MPTKKTATRKSGTSKAAPKTPTAPAAKRAAAAKSKVTHGDPKRPATGTVLHRSYKGKVHEIRVLPDGYEFEGQTFKSLTALAMFITGYKAISGPVWFRSAKPQVEAK